MIQPVSEVYNQDNLLGMKGFPDKFFDLAILDPQTGQGEGKKHLTRGKAVKQKNGSLLSVKTNHLVKDWDNEPPTQEYWDEVFRVSKHQIIMCENYLNFAQKETSAGRIVWNLLRDNDFSACQIMWTSLTNKIEYFEYLWNGFIQGVAINKRLQKGDKQLNEKRRHPSQKPAIVYDYLMRKYATVGYKIIDTHLGSGNSRLAAWYLGLDFYGFESDSDIFNEHEAWFKEEIKQPLFEQHIEMTQSNLFTRA